MASPPAPPDMATATYGDFEWDDQKAAANAAKHGVTFEEAATVFADPCHKAEESTYERRRF